MKNGFSFKNITVIGLFSWIIILLLQCTGLYQESWARLILLLAALVWLPLAIPLITSRQKKLEQILQYSILPSALLLAVAQFYSGKYIAGLFTFPWLIITCLMAIRGYFILKESRIKNPGIIAIAAGHGFLLIGGVWTMADRLGFQPLNFDPAIVLLTSIRFHYAGFIFPFLIGLATLHYPSFWLKTASWLAVFSVPFTAIGITFTQLFNFSILEIIAAMTVTLGGWSAAIGYYNIIVYYNVKFITRLLWLIFSIALTISMLLALLYAIRFWYVIDWLTIPAMRALHGSLNAIVVSGSGLLGWKLLKNISDKSVKNQ